MRPRRVPLACLLFAALLALSPHGALAAEPAKAAGKPPAVRADVGLLGEPGILAWLSLHSVGGLFDAAEATGGPLGLVPPGGALRAQSLDQLNGLLGSVHINGHAWLDKTRPLHFGFQDPPATSPAAAPDGSDDDGPQGLAGAFAVLPVTTKAQLLAALVDARTGAAAGSHAALLPLGDDLLYVDFVGTFAVLSFSPERFAKVRPFVERLTHLTVPALVYLGVSVEEIAKTRQRDIEGFLTQLEANGAELATTGGLPGQAQMTKAYGKMLREWLADLTRFELLLGADAQSARAEVRLHTRPGSRLQEQFAAGKGRSPKEVLGLLPANSYLAFGTSADPAVTARSLEQSMTMLRDLLNLSGTDYETLIADMSAALLVQDGTGAMGLYPDGNAALGGLAVSGATDGEASMRLTKRLVATLVSKLLYEQKAKQQMAEDSSEAKAVDLVVQSLAQGKLDPILAAYGPLLKQKGLTLTTSVSKDADHTCEVLDVTPDWVKLGGKDAGRAKAILGSKTAVSLCFSKTKLAFAFGPGALKQCKRAVAGLPGGLTDNAAFKRTTARVLAASTLLHVSPGLALAAFKAGLPEVPALPKEHAVVAGCQHYASSYGCGVEVPVALLAAVRNLGKP